MYEEDFVNEALIEFEVEGRKFKYKPITAGEELEWAPEYMEEKEVEGKVMRMPNLKKLTLCQLRSIKEVPYTVENIHTAIGIGKEFKDLTQEENGLFWGKMNPVIADKIIRKLKDASSDSELKKN